MGEIKMINCRLILYSVVCLLGVSVCANSFCCDKTIRKERQSIKRTVKKLQKDFTDSNVEEFKRKNDASIGKLESVQGDEYAVSSAKLTAANFKTYQEIVGLFGLQKKRWEFNGCSDIAAKILRIFLWRSNKRFDILCDRKKIR